LKCEICLKDTFINHGSSQHVFCEDCAGTVQAQNILKTGKTGAHNSSSTVSQDHAYMIQNMDSIFLGLAVAISGLFLGALAESLLKIHPILFGIMFLSGLITTSTSLIIKEIRKQ